MQRLSIWIAVALAAIGLAANETKEIWSIPIKVHFGNQTRTIYSFQDGWVRCYYRESNLDGNPGLSCVEITR